MDVAEILVQTGRTVPAAQWIPHLIEAEESKKLAMLPESRI